MEVVRKILIESIQDYEKGGKHFYKNKILSNIRTPSKEEGSKISEDSSTKD